MAKQNRVIRWSDSAIGELSEALYYIALDSVQGAEIVEEAIFDALDLLPQNPEIHPKDSLKVDNDDSFRAFTVFHYRITYKINADSILITRVRHTSREPLQY